MANLLALDIGNTSTSIGIFVGEKLEHDWRISTVPARTADELGMFIKMLCLDKGCDIRKIQGAVVSCVVPPLLPVVEEMVKRYFRCTPLIVGPGIRTGLVIKYENARDAGADRIANLVAAHERFGPSLIVVDLRIATTFSVLNQNGHYIGGVIAPGVQSSLDAMSLQAAKLPKIDIVAPKQVVGKNTVASMQAGVVYGFAGLIDHIVGQITREVGLLFRTVMTGNHAELIAPYCSSISDVELHLTLDGLRSLWEMNR